MIQSFKTFDRWIVASACLLLAGKVEETPKKCKDILKVAKAQLADHQWVKFGADPKVSVFKVGFEGGGGGGGGGGVSHERMAGSHELCLAQEELLTHERILLQTIKFDLQVQHPYAYLLKFAKALKGALIHT